MKNSPAILLLSTAIFYMSSLVHLKCEEGLAASGYLSVIQFDGVGVPMPRWSSTNSFCVFIGSKGELRIEVSPVQEKDDTFYLTYDGTNTFFIRYRAADVDGNGDIIGRTPVEQKLNLAYVSTGNYPFVPWDEQKRAHILWLVFGSGIHFHEFKTNAIPLPWIAARWSMLSYGFRTEYELSPQFPYIPEHLEFIRDRHLDLANDALEMDRPELDVQSADSWIAKWKKELQDKRQFWTNGFVAGRLETRNVTNRNGLRIPLSFSFDAYHPKWTIKTKKLRWQYVGVVTNVSDLPIGESFQPPIKSLVHVQDSRFRFRDETRAVNDINYALNITNKWPPNNSQEMQAQLQSGLASREISGRFIYQIERNKRLVVAAIFLFTTLSLPVFLFWRAFKQKHRR
jgi:hypothetical protein